MALRCMRSSHSNARNFKNIFAKPWRQAGSVLATTANSGPDVVPESPPAPPESPAADQRFSYLSRCFTCRSATSVLTVV